MKSAFKTLTSTNPATSFQTQVATCLRLLKNLTDQRLIDTGRALHANLIKLGTSQERYISVKLLLMYLGTRKLRDAGELVKEFKGFDLVVHNCLINANVQWGNLDEARKLFDEMPVRNDVTWTNLISGFMRHGRVDESIWYFERSPFQNVVSWTAAISGYVQNGMCFEGLKLFSRMLESGVRPNEFTFSSVVRGCTDMGDFMLGFSILGLVVKVGLEDNLSVSNSLITLSVRGGEIDLARRLFDRMKKRDVVSWTAVLDMYVEMGDLEEARRIFDEMPERNEVSWSAMISRYSQKGHPYESLNLFCRMRREGFKPNDSCFASIVSGLASVKARLSGMSIHGLIIKTGIEKGVYISSSLIDLFCKCGETREGLSVFDSVSNKTIVSWNSMVGGYSLNGQMEEAKALFDKMSFHNSISWSALIAGYLGCEQFDRMFEVLIEMLMLGEVPNRFTFSSLLCASASIASLDKGKYLHGKIIKLGIKHDVFVDSALTDMYARSGDIESSKRVFDTMHQKDEVSWIVMIQGLAESGRAPEAIELFEEMERSSCIVPNELMLLAVISACAHAGLVDRGLRHFNSMASVYGVKPARTHYNCVVDMLSRAGRLLEAEEFINSMPFEPDANAWAALLNGCKTYKNEDLAKRTAKKVCELAEENSTGGYVMLSNIYASSGRWKDVADIRKLMQEKGLKKSRGCSWVEIRNQVHSFYSGDASHPQSPAIYAMLELLRTDKMEP